MASFTAVLLSSIVVIVVVQKSESNPVTMEQPEDSATCSPSYRRQMPCICCKKDCWYTIASAASHELGHMPGEAGEQEALATLRLIRECMIEECGDICTRMRPILLWWSAFPPFHDRVESRSFSRRAIRCLLPSIPSLLNLPSSIRSFPFPI